MERTPEQQRRRQELYVRFILARRSMKPHELAAFDAYADDLLRESRKRRLTVVHGGQWAAQPGREGGQ